MVFVLLLSMVSANKKDITYVSSSFIGWELIQPKIENEPQEALL